MYRLAFDWEEAAAAAVMDGVADVLRGWTCVLAAGDGERGEPEPDGAGGGGPGPAVAAAAAGHELLRAVPDAPGAEQERVQPLLPRLHRRRALRLLPPGAPGPPRRPGQRPRPELLLTKLPVSSLLLSSPIDRPANQFDSPLSCFFFFFPAGGRPAGADRAGGCRAPCRYGGRRTTT